jgi:hypothetical protein
LGLRNRGWHECDAGRNRQHRENSPFHRATPCVRLDRFAPFLRLRYTVVARASAK